RLPDRLFQILAPPRVARIHRQRPRAAADRGPGERAPNRRPTGADHRRLRRRATGNHRILRRHVDRRRRNEPRRRLHRLHPRPRPAAANLQMGAGPMLKPWPMLKSLLWKEFRELLPLSVAALAAQAFLLLGLMRFSAIVTAAASQRDAESIWPIMCTIAVLFAVAAGLWQCARENQANHYQF